MSRACAAVVFSIRAVYFKPPMGRKIKTNMNNKCFITLESNTIKAVFNKFTEKIEILIIPKNKFSYNLFI